MEAEKKRIVKGEAYMKKKGIFLRQETTETCGISCILMALTAFRRIHKPESSVMDEKSIEASFYEMYGGEKPGDGPKEIKGTLGGAIAYALGVRRLSVELWHESEALMENRDGYYPPEMHAKMLAAHKGWIDKSNGKTIVRAGMKIDTETMIDALNKERLLIVQCLVEGDADGMHDHVLHWILVFDYRDGEFLVYDPQYDRPSNKVPNYITIGKEEMMAYMNTPVGAAVVCVGERK